MDENFRADLQPVLWLISDFTAESFALADEFFRAACVARSDAATAEQLRARYYRLEARKTELEMAVAGLRKQIAVVTGVNELGRATEMKDQERQAWVNWTTFVFRSAFLGLQGLYARFLFRHQDLLLPIMPQSPVPDRAEHAPVSASLGIG